MELFIQGRKDGYNVLFPHPTPTVFFKFASDIQSTAASSDSRFFGKSFYSIAFAAGGCILSKYIVGFDQARGAIGNIGFSIFLPKEKKLSGSSAKELLDRLVESYKENYLHNNVIQAQNVENWTIFASIANMYDSKLVVPEDVDSFEPGMAVPAYYYYSTDDELEKLLDAPYQREFKGFRQVFLLDKCYNGAPENPLLCQKYDINANLTGKVDFRNIWLRLSYDDSRDSSVQITVEQMGSYSRLFNNSKVRLHDSVRITWNRAFHEKKVLEGMLSEIALREPGLVSLDEGRHTIAVNSTVRLAPQKKALRVVAVAAMNNTGLPGAEITATNTYSNLKKTAEGGIILFEGEEIRDSWLISARSGMLSSDDKNVDNTIVPQRLDSYAIRLHETFKLTVKGIDETGQGVNEFSVVVSGNQPYFTQSNYKDFCFRDADINRPVVITVSKKLKDGSRLEGRQTVIPGAQEVVEIVMKRVNTVPSAEKPIIQSKYFISAGKHGKLNSSSKLMTSDPRGEDVVRYIKADFGYKFDHFEVQSDTIVATYKKKFLVSALPWVLAVVASAAIGFVVCLFFLEPKEPVGGEPGTEITPQVNPDNQQAEDGDGQTTSHTLEQESGKEDMSASGTATSDTQNSAVKDERTRRKENPTDTQDKFAGSGRRATEQVDANPVQVKDGKTSSEPAATTSKSEPGANNVSSNSGNESSTVSNNDKEIIEFLKNSSLSKSKLYTYTTDNESLTESINTVKVFWNYVKSAESNIDNMTKLYKNKVKNNDYFKESVLATFLYEITKNSDAYDKFKRIPGRNTISDVSTLWEKYNSPAQ